MGRASCPGLTLPCKARVSEVTEDWAEAVLRRNGRRRYLQVTEALGTWTEGAQELLARANQRPHAVPRDLNEPSDPGFRHVMIDAILCVLRRQDAIRVQGK
jgi:hypothetical protein